MTGPIDPIRRASPTRRAAERRREDRRAAERRAEAEAQAAKLPVPAGPRRDHDPTPPPIGPGVYSAQILGQEGARRGLRGGSPVLESARSAYLEAEYSGPRDRRMRKGRITKTEI